MSRATFKIFFYLKRNASNEEQADTGHVPYHGERKNRTVQLQDEERE